MNSEPMTQRQALTVAIIARLYKRNASIHLDDVRRELQRKGLISQRCRETSWTYYSKNTSCVKAKAFGHIAYVICKAALTLGVDQVCAQDGNICRWSAKHRQTKQALKAETEAIDFCERVASKLADYVDGLDAEIRKSYR